jgi:hypothetical protein
VFLFFRNRLRSTVVAGLSASVLMFAGFQAVAAAAPARVFSGCAANGKINSIQARIGNEVRCLKIHDSRRRHAVYVTWSATGAGVLTEPQSVVATPGSRQVQLSWQKPASTSERAITDYVIQYRRKGNTTWATFADGWSTSRHTHVTRLTNGVSYQFRVAARNSRGVGAWSPGVEGQPNVPVSSPTTTVPVTTTIAGVAATSTTTTTTTVPPTTTTTTTVPVGGVWSPGPGTSWQWQLSGSVDVSVDAQMFDVDLFETSVATVAELKSRGRAVVCYMSAGAWEEFRPDAGVFPASVLGASNGWAGERWLDIRRLDVLGPIMEARLDLCRDKGFVGVEVDNIDGYSNNTGFALTAADQLVFNKFLAAAAHARGLSIGLKNDVEQAAVLEPFFDWAINEECAAYDECELLLPFIEAGKAVFHVEYDLETSQFCPLTVGLGFSSMRKNLDLDAWRQYCPTS